ncbi:hypothetical protein E2C01_074593 [Portunus trituberculatus]|uniref:Uncharacterized protein n=1 Tax=Portunus trituberculatus TaxID=210409 RepID=A0A5B7I620_PORTR|nr:hypothetical protein [Portunus trituberculatus]
MLAKITKRQVRRVSFAPTFVLAASPPLAPTAINSGKPRRFFVLVLSCPARSESCCVLDSCSDAAGVWIAAAAAAAATASRSLSCLPIPAP